MLRWKGFKHIYRTLKVDILMLFFTLFILAFTSIISYSFYKNYRSILEFSIGTIDRVAARVNERIKALLADAQQMLKIASDMFTQANDLSLSNKYLLPFMINAVEYDPNFSGYYIGTQEGSFIGTSNLALAGQKYYFSNPTKPLEKEILYSLLILDKQDPSQSHLYYKNADFQTVSEEPLPPDLLSFDPRERPWYHKEAKEQQIYAAGVYRFLRYQGLGTTFSLPLFSKDHELLGFAGVDISLAMLSSVLKQQNVSKNGRVLILNNEGEIIAGPKTFKSFSPNIVTQAYAHFEHTRQQAFILDNTYLIHMHALDIDKERKWLVTVIAPISDFFSEAFKTQKEVLLITVGMVIIIGWLVFLAAKRISTPIVTLAKEVDKITQLQLEEKKRVHSNITEIQAMDRSIARLRIAMHSFARYVPKRVVQLLMQKGEEISIGGERKELSVFFSDITSFTTIAEKYPVEFIVSLLSEYFGGMSNIIIEQEGIIDKFIGDSVMAFWGAPLDLPDHAYKACTAALLCQEFLKTFNQHQREKGGQELNTRIAIHSGAVLVGNMGALERMNYTVIGDVVNTAAHLQSINKIYHTPITITEETYERAKKYLIARPLDEVEMKGKSEKMKIYELMGIVDGPSPIKASPEQMRLCRDFLYAYETLQQGDVQKAKGLFQTLSKEFPDDFPTQMYLKRLGCL